MILVKLTDGKKLFQSKSVIKEDKKKRRKNPALFVLLKMY